MNVTCSLVDFLPWLQSILCSIPTSKHRLWVPNVAFIIVAPMARLAKPASRIWPSCHCDHCGEKLDLWGRLESNNMEQQYWYVLIKSECHSDREIFLTSSSKSTNNLWMKQKSGCHHLITKFLSITWYHTPLILPLLERRQLFKRSTVFFWAWWLAAHRCNARRRTWSCLECMAGDRRLYNFANWFPAHGYIMIHPFWNGFGCPIAGPKSDFPEHIDRHTPSNWYPHLGSVTETNGTALHDIFTAFFGLHLSNCQGAAVTNFVLVWKYSTA